LASSEPESLLEPELITTKRSGWRRLLVDLIETIVIAAILYLGVNVVIAAILYLGVNVVIARVRVDSYSMEPTLCKDNYVMVNKLVYMIGSPDRGDIIVFRYPPNPDEQYIKRVIGLPGDRIHISGGEVFVNDELLSEPYVSMQTKSGGDWVIPEDSLFVMGDNRNNSRDSRFWGMVPYENLIGKAFAVYWPPENWRMVSTPYDTCAEP
jgi:signal peptidase I